MAESRWYVSIDGQQMETDYSLDAAKELVQKNLGKRVLVWTQGMSQWSLPEDLSEFKMQIPRPSVTPEAEPSQPEEKKSPLLFKTAVEPEEIRKKAGLLKVFLDFRFQEMVTSKILPVLYAVTVILLAIGAIGYFFIGGGGMILTGIRARAGFMVLTGLVIMVLTPIIAIIYLALIRMWFELVLVIFRIKDDLSILVERSKKVEGKESKDDN